ncbi:flavin reductase family protein [Pedobacter sp. AW1-32]|uniref:flavin reductase family protein n=1 Tax=Pedobacter sp. AW1-32 TaxID=3383026 RepID=UPI003FEDD17E
MYVDLDKLSVRDVQHYLQHAVAPRPICFASTVNAKGDVNLSPFSFFNVFSSNPPIVIFSPARSGRTNTLKHTLLNVMEVPEVSISIVDFNLIQQMNLSSCEYPEGVNEFVKSGLTMVSADLIKPPLVGESKIKMECAVTEIKALGDNGGAGMLVFAKVLRMHVDDAVLDSNNFIDPLKVRQVARLGGDWYVDVRPEYMYKLPKPVKELGIGFDQLPDQIRESKILTGNHLGRLANISAIPELNPDFIDTAQMNSDSAAELPENKIIHYLLAGDLQSAWQVVLRM